jgi:hypothetical protein
MPSDINRLTAPALAKGLHVVVKPCNLQSSTKPPLQRNRHPERATEPMPSKHFIDDRSSFLDGPAVPGRRVGATVPGCRRVAIISGPTGGRRCHRYGTLLKRRLRVRSSRWVSIRFVQRYARARRRTRAPVQKPCQRPGAVHAHTRTRCLGPVTNADVVGRPSHWLCKHPMARDNRD